MRWLLELEKYNVSFNTHILRQQESIIIHNTQNNNQTICILDGFMQLSQVFTNNEIICKQLIYKKQAFAYPIYKNLENRTYYYQLVAITRTVIVTIPTKELNKHNSSNNKIWSEFTLTNYSNNYEIINILSYKSIKQRLIQLLLTLLEHFGKIKKEYIIIPFHLSHSTIATIIGSQRTTVNKAMNSLKKSRIIDYNNKNITIYNLLLLIQA